MSLSLQAEKILTHIRKHGDASFVWMKKLIGPDEAAGNLYLPLTECENIWLWFGMSPLFVSVCNELIPFTEYKLVPVLLYAVDGELPKLPVATRIMEYKTKHWLPVVMVLKGTSTGRRRKGPKKVQQVV